MKLPIPQQYRATLKITWVCALSIFLHWFQKQRVRDVPLEQRSFSHCPQLLLEDNGIYQCQEALKALTGVGEIQPSEWACFPEDSQWAVSCSHLVGMLDLPGNLTWYCHVVNTGKNHIPQCEWSWCFPHGCYPDSGYCTDLTCRSDSPRVLCFSLLYLK